MRRFLIHLILFAAPLLAGLFVLFTFADGRTDAYYHRFTTPTKGSLITGTSRAAQGILPDLVIGQLSEPGSAEDLYNYSFTLSHSPYGPSYLRSIERKLDKGKRNGLHFVCVDPWGLVADKEDPENADRFVEKGLIVDRMHFVSMSPNVEYFLECYEQPFMELITHPGRPGSPFIHDNGWLEVNSGRTREQQIDRARLRIAELRIKARTLAPSMTRITYLRKVVELLSTTGEVFIVRMPISREMVAVEDSLMPGFDQRMRVLAQGTGVRYIALTDSLENYWYTDGNHVDQASARLISGQLGKFVEQARKRDVSAP